MKRICSLIIFILLSMQIQAGGSFDEAVPEGPEKELITITDALGREVQVPYNPEYIICSGPGALRLAAYLQAENRVIAVDDMEGRRSDFDARPYAYANPQFRDLPIFGEFRGHDNPELILGLDPQPQIIFKTYSNMGYDPIELEKKTGIPVVTLDYGDLVGNRETLYRSLNVMAEILNKGERAEQIISFIEDIIEDLEFRTASIDGEARVSCYVGGIASKGPHGIQSTEPVYPPFLFTNALNVAFDTHKPVKEQVHADIAKEQIIEWDPDVLFVDVSTIQSGDTAGALYELTHEKVFGNMKAVRSGEIYGLMPYNWYTQNFGSVLADAYYVGTVLYPESFSDMDPKVMADDIYAFLVGKAVFSELNSSFGELVFQKIKL